MQTRPLTVLVYIRSLVLARAKLGYHTHFRKVPSHCGIVGNEMADKEAALALKTPAFPASLIHVEIILEYRYTAWQAPDLNTTIKQHIYRHCPDVAESASKDPSDTYTRIQASNAISLPIFSNFMWHSS